MYLVLNILLVLNLISFYNTFFLSVEVLLFFLFILICFNLFCIGYKVCSIFFLQQKNWIVDEYFNKFFDFYYFLDFYQFYINLFVKNLVYTFFIIKFFFDFYNAIVIEKSLGLKNFLYLLCNNLLFVLVTNRFYLTKLEICCYFTNLSQQYSFLKFYWNVLKGFPIKWVLNI